MCVFVQQRDAVWPPLTCCEVVLCCNKHPSTSRACPKQKTSTTASELPVWRTSMMHAQNKSLLVCCTSTRADLLRDGFHCSTKVRSVKFYDLRKLWAGLEWVVHEYSKVAPIHTVKAQGRMEIQLHSFLTSVLDKDELSSSCSDRFTRGRKTPSKS